MFNLSYVVSEGSCEACFLGSEGVAVRGRLGYHVAERCHGGPAPRRHGVGGVHPVVHLEDSVACDVHPTTATSLGSGHGESDRSYWPVPGATGSALRRGGEFENATAFS
jgi:hypothetical protein